jgi:hypothetical protein
LGPTTNQALGMLILATNSQVNGFGKHVEFHLPLGAVFFLTILWYSQNGYDTQEDLAKI